MIRTQVQLTEAQFEALKKLSAAENLSMAELIRRGVDLILASGTDIDNGERINRALAAAGRFRSGVKDLSVNHSTYFAEAVAE
ncbi:MAG TPA: CopG family transcriptional regulator [Peptococcaceae bacterium]|nr:MAG: CopG domain protein DNA-binding domain protein [Moorella sp. 60_41]HBT46495.1 CopG family transcriptional regulator [Peptococcaceae bacterium]